MHLSKLNYVTSFQFYCWNRPKTSSRRKKFLRTFRKVLEERIPKDLGVKLSKIDFRVDDRIYIELQGKRREDLVFVSNILKEITGETFDANNVPKNRSIMGVLKSVRKVGFGIFVDVGVENPQKEVLIPLHELRKQLVGDQKISTNEICKKYGFMDYIPVEVDITKIDYIKGQKPKYEARFSEFFINQLEEWIFGGLHIVFTTGIARQMIKRTIAKRGHTVDILQIIRLGPLETAIVCRRGTNAPGIIAHIGKFIPHCKMSSLIPSQVYQYWKK